jgi:hypothetical protein
VQTPNLTRQAKQQAVISLASKLQLWSLRLDPFDSRDTAALSLDDMLTLLTEAAQVRDVMLDNDIDSITALERIGDALHLPS